MRVSIAWLDPAGKPNLKGLNDPTPSLMNDLDLALKSPSGKVYFPYRLDLANPRGPAWADGANKVDNLEIVDAAPESGSWTIEVSGASFVQGTAQKFALVVSGLRE